jgi:hypothetical protein
LPRRSIRFPVLHFTLFAPPRSHIRVTWPASSMSTLATCWLDSPPRNAWPAQRAPLPTLGPFLHSAVTLLPHATAKLPLPKSLVLSSSPGGARMRRWGFSCPGPLKAGISSQPSPGCPGAYPLEGRQNLQFPGRLRDVVIKPHQTCQFECLGVGYEIRKIRQVVPSR